MWAPLRPSQGSWICQGNKISLGVPLTPVLHAVDLRASNIRLFSSLLFPLFFSQTHFYFLFRWVLTPELFLPLNFENCSVVHKGIYTCCVCVLSHVRLCDPTDCSPSGSSVHRIFQARILAWVAISYFRGSSRLRDGTCVSCVSCIGRRIVYLCTTWEA